MNFDYELYKFLDESGYVPCEDNLELLKENILTEFLGMGWKAGARRYMRNINKLQDPNFMANTDSVTREKQRQKLQKTVNNYAQNMGKHRTNALNDVVKQQNAGNAAINAAQTSISATNNVDKYGNKKNIARTQINNKTEE